MSKILLLIDFQKIFNDKSHSWYCPGFEQALNTALSCYNKMNGNNCKTYITGFLPPDTSVQVWKDYYTKYSDIPSSDDNSCYELDDKLKNLENVEKVIWSQTFGKWDKISQYINKEVKEVYICGVATDCCVLSTALSAIDKNMKVYIIEDGCASNDTSHNNALNIMKGYNPNIVIIDSKSL